MTNVDISMTESEVDAFLDRCAQIVVGAIDADGWPTGTIAASAYVDGGLTLRFGAGDPLLGVLATEPLVCCIADEHATYYEIRGVVAHGRAVIDAADPCAVAAIIDRVVSFDFGRLLT
jgi:nitroimidazol reductase NimA-like FMN-containing flavoprotein (pyridoxamine 5'-phosphate oxidase superfamily)